MGKGRSLGQRGRQAENLLKEILAPVGATQRERQTHNNHTTADSDDLLLLPSF